jgi:hypothetical protein
LLPRTAAEEVENVAVAKLNRGSPILTSPDPLQLGCLLRKAATAPERSPVKRENDFHDAGIKPNCNVGIRGTNRDDFRKPGKIPQADIRTRFRDSGYTNARSPDVQASLDSSRACSCRVLGTARNFPQVKRAIGENERSERTNQPCLNPGHRSDPHRQPSLHPSWIRQDYIA